MARNDDRSYAELRRQTQLMRREAQRARFNHLMGGTTGGDKCGRIRKMNAEEREIWRDLLRYDLQAANDYRRRCEGPSRAVVEFAAVFLVVAVVAFAILAVGVGSVGGWRFP